MASKVTPANTGLSIKRSGSKFTASWKRKIKEGDVETLKLRYRVYYWKIKKWGKWTTKKLGKKATSYSFTLSAASNITRIQVQTQIKKTKCSASAWTSSSAIFKITKPAAPSLTVSNDSANSTTFTWSHNTKSEGSAWYYHCFYRTKCDTTPTSSTGWGAWHQATSYTYTYTGDTTRGTTRTFQIYARGPAGNSKVKQQSHVIGLPPVATWADNPVTLTEKSSYYAMTYNFNLTGSTYTIDSIIPQYVIDKPTASMNPPSSGWTDGATYNYGNKKTSYAFAITTGSLIEQDECLWARIKTIHDGNESVSEAYRVITGTLATPSTSISMGTPTHAGFTVSVTIDDVGSEVPGVYQEVYLEKASRTGRKNYILIGTIPNGTSSKSITSTEDLTGETGYSIHVRNVTADGKSMFSGFDTYQTTMPSSPTLNSVDLTTTSGKVYLSWTNNWADATGVIIAWTDDPDNWMSNDDPEEYEIKEVASNWFITGLETGKTWYFRVRSVKTVDDSQTLSPWSSDKAIDLSSAPAIPVLYLSEESITEDGMVTAYWSYVSTDGTAQVSGNVVQATYSGGAWTYGASVGATTDAQHIDIYAKERGWTNGTVVYLALQTRSGSGGLSEYSTPVKLVIAAKPTVSISATNLSSSETLTERFLGDGSNKTFLCANTISASPTAKVNGSTVTVSSYSDGSVTLASAPAADAEVEITYTTTDNEILSSLPLTATIATTNAASLTVAVERAVTYPMLRPDGTVTNGPIGETIFVDTIDAEASNDISISDGRFDDGAWYNLIATATDSYGQSVSTTTLFKVHWSHQAWAPTATFVTDASNYIAQIKPVAGADYVSGDTCDIYRLGADQPELIVSGGTFGTDYVDPYPAFGSSSGYKVVTVTENNDYITEEDEFAEFDTTVEEPSPYTQLDPGLLVIDCDGDRIELPYNISLGNSWAKDFERVTYLGGHVTGDHNRAVTRDLSASTVTVRKTDTDIMLQMRALARYPGLCHVRTPEGSSFTADIQVSENQSFDSATAEYSLSILKVDTVGFDGMTLAEWNELNEES